MTANAIVRDDKQTVGERVRIARKEADLSQAALAKLMELDQSSVSLWERDKHYPSVRDFERLAFYLNVAPEWLAFGTDPLRSPVVKRQQAELAERQAAATAAEPVKLSEVQPEGVVVSNVVMPMVGGMKTKSLRGLEELGFTAPRLLEVRDESLAPVAHANDAIIYESRPYDAKAAVRRGDEVVVEVAGGDTYVGRLDLGSARGVWTITDLDGNILVDDTHIEMAHLIVARLRRS